MLFTVAQIAERLAAVDPNRTTSYFARQVRGWWQAGLFFDAHLKLAEDGSAGKTAPVLYSERDLFDARLFSFLTQIGWTDKQLAQLRGIQKLPLNLIEKEKEARGHNIRSGSLHIIDCAKDGDFDWLLDMEIDLDGAIRGGGFYREVVARGAALTLAEVRIIIPMKRLLLGLFVD